MKLAGHDRQSRRPAAGEASPFLVLHHINEYHIKTLDRHGGFAGHAERRHAALAWGSRVVAGWQTLDLMLLDYQLRRACRG
jgi:hypothetical protein